MNKASMYVYIALSFPLLILMACGKKGAPTLKAYETPDAPLHLALSRREDIITLTWDFPRSKEASIVSFVIMRKDGEDFKTIATVEKGMRTFQDVLFSQGISYTYKIISKSPTDILSSESNIIQFTPLRHVSPPKKITVQIKDNLLHLHWEEVDGKARYNIYKSFTRGVYGPRAFNNQPITGTAYQDQLSLNKPVYYVIRCLTDGEFQDEGPQSEEISVDPHNFVPPAPRDLRFFLSSESVFLQWKDPEESWITGFRIYRRVGDEGYILIGETQIPSFLDHDIPLIQRDYRVTAVGPAQEGSGAEILGVKYDAY